MRVGVLGELVVTGDDGQDVAVTGAKLRAFLALLALHAGRPVQTDQLVEALWGEDPPAAVRNGLQGLASKLRRLLGSSEILAMRGGGYALELAPEAVDVHQYERLISQARDAGTSDAARAIELYAAADALWRGDALAEFTYEDFAVPVITRLTELRITAVEERIELALGLGRHRTVVGELEALVAAHPLRERTLGLLMTALYGAGRQADALRAYQEGRRTLGDELGLDPGPALQQLERAILDHDPSLDAPAVAAPMARTTPLQPRLPEAVTSLIGREEEVRELVRLTIDDRCVTLVGPGGVGKTRLALEVGRTTAQARACDACLVELAPIGDPEAVPAAIAQALDLPDPNRLAELIGDRELLLVLDNCEHVIAAAATVADDLLRRCPNVRIVATSREGLRVAGETVWPVPPLPIADAVQLFLARARSAGGRIEQTDEVVASVSEICVRLDGLPLAIELAAARTRAFPVQQLAARLGDRFRLLTGGSRTALPRQQTLRAVVDWSYDLLFEDEQRLFERLSVFPGGCDLATAAAVCADELLPEADIEDLVHALIDKSLVVPVAGADDLRVTQLQTLAQYGREKLAERGDADRIRAVMADHFATLSAQSALAYTGDVQRRWLGAINLELDNLRAALEWAIDSGDAETALTIAGGSGWPHWLAGSHVEGLRWIDEAFRCGGEASDAARGLGLTARGLLRFQNGLRDGIDEDLEAALAIFRERADVASTAMAYSFWSEIAAIRGDVDDARTRRREVLDFYTLLRDDDDLVLGVRAFSRAKLAALDGELGEAEAHYREALAHFTRIDRPVMTALTLSMVADFDEHAGRFDVASDLLEQAIDIANAVGLRGFTSTQVARLAWARLQAGDLDRAEPAYERTLADARRLRNGRVEFLALAGLAALQRLRGRVEAAATATQALEAHATSGPARLSNRVTPQTETAQALAVCCSVLAADAAERGEPELAARMLGHAHGLRADHGIQTPAFQRDDLDVARAQAHQALGDAFDAVFEAGRTGRIGRPRPAPR